jgi:putative peptidoglycan lipid II flippase
MFSIAVATVLFPALSRYAARVDLDGFRATMSAGMRQIAFLLLPASAFFAVLATPIVRLLYERGEFGAHETDVVAAALAAFSIGLVFNGMMLMLNRGFFGLQAPWTPTLVALGNLALSTLLFALLTSWRRDPWVIPLGISLANIAGTCALLFLLRRRIGRVGFAAIARTLLLVTVASAILAAAAFGAWSVLDEALGRSLPAQAAAVTGALAIGGGAFLAACWALRVREIETLLSLRARFRRA